MNYSVIDDAVDVVRSSPDVVTVSVTIMGPAVGTLSNTTIGTLAGATLRQFVGQSTDQFPCRICAVGTSATQGGYCDACTNDTWFECPMCHAPDSRAKGRLCAACYTHEVGEER